MYSEVKEKEMSDIELVMKELPQHPLAISLIDAFRQKRKDDARFYSNWLVLNIPCLSREVIQAICRLGGRS